MMSQYTTEILSTGQPASYRDHELRVRLHGARKIGDEWGPLPMAEERVVNILSALPVGFTTQRKHERVDPFSSYLDYLRPIEDDRSSWEFLVRTPFTD